MHKGADRSKEETDTTSMEKAEKNQPKERKPKNMLLLVGIPILMSICLPYIYYAVAMNSYGRLRKPANYHIPEYTELWKVVAGGIVYELFRRAFFFFLYPTFYQYARDQHDEELRKKYANKACN